jgi:hypothetical protein
MTAQLSVMHLEIRHCATGLTPPAIPTEDLLTQKFVRPNIQPQARGFGADHFQDAF